VRKRGALIEVATFRGQNSADGDHTKSTGRILRDNVWGTVEEDAIRRDFTINALFLDPVKATIRDYVGGYEDLRNMRLKLIGDPRLRYREDPVRLLRAARFVAKLGVVPDESTEAPIAELAHLLKDVPPARLFEEVCKLFLTGHGEQSLKALQHFGLSSTLFPSIRQDGSGGRIHTGILLEKALQNTDMRIVQEKPVTPAFLFAALLWEPVQRHSAVLEEKGLPAHEALLVAADDVFLRQAGATAVPRRFSAVSKQIWAMQPRFLKTSGKRWKRIFGEQRFRAAYDFLLLRVEEDPSLAELAEFWTTAQEGVDLQGHQTAEKRTEKKTGGRRRRSRSRRRHAKKS
jgi:poly(A) polymerase